MQNQGVVTTGNAVNALQLDGNGGTVSYAGNGSVINTNLNGGALFADNTNGNVSITTGAGAISGAIAINAATTGSGALTITTNSGLVNGTAAQQAILASTEDGPLNLTIGRGGVIGGGNTAAVDLTSTNGNIVVNAAGNVTSGKHTAPLVKGPTQPGHGIDATSKGLGNITIGGSGTITAPDGRAIWAVQSTTGLGSILVTGSGGTVETTQAPACCSAIRAEIDNPANSSDITVNRSGNITAAGTTNETTVGIHALTKEGSGTIIIAGGANQTILSSGYAIDASSLNTGSIQVSTDANGG